MTETKPRNNASTVTLPSDREILMERVFDAPRELVFRAYTEPAHIPKWWDTATLRLSLTRWM